MVLVTCKRSGLVFEAENRRKTVHPAISYYTSHKDTGIRYPAIRVIDQGRTEGWTTLEEFDTAIAAVLNPEPEPEVEINYDFEGAWVARIVGFDTKFGYQREFLDAAKQEGRFNCFWFPESGIVETCYKSAKGNDTRYFRLIEGGVEVRILTQPEVDELLGGRPNPEERAKNLGVERTFETNKSMGQIGQTVKVGEEYFVIVNTSTVTTYHDEDGLAHTGRYPSGVYVVYEEYAITTGVRNATAEEVEAAQSEAKIKQAARKAATRLEEIADEAGWTKPESPSPEGVKIAYSNTELSYDSTYLQIDTGAKLLWCVAYNGRDGDLWSLNNLTSQIAHCRELTPELEDELGVLIAAIAARHPKAVSR
jgi:hypothetical protein